MRISTFLYRYKFHHLVFWLAIFSGWYYFRYEAFTTNEGLIVTLIKVADLAVMVYVTNYVLVPRLLYRKHYAWFAFAYLLMIFASSVFKMHLVGQVLDNPEAFSLFNGSYKDRIYDNVIPHFLLVSTGAAIKLLFDYARTQKQLGEMAKEKAEAELNFLKGQINPHFLFNSLNSVYFLIDKQNTEARNALHQFSEMLRYQLYEVKDQKVPIEKELGYLRDYIRLQQLRRDNCAVSFDVDENSKGFLIEPLLLIPLVENAFKHLSHYDKEKRNQVDIALTRSNDQLKFAIKNTKEHKAPGPLTTGGIGLRNVRRRLELLYPGSHEIDIRDEAGWFDVTLKIKIPN
jgi:two-component system, LytTR family, sensor kinase